jgi:hypothetical protein
MADRDKYKRIYFIDTENQGAMYLKDLSTLTSSDLVICMSTEFSPKFTYSQVGQFMESKAKFKFLDCISGTPNALDFQVSSLLGFYLREYKNEKSEFIILSQDTGYYPLVQFWQNEGYNVNIRGRMDEENVKISDALVKIIDKKSHVAMEVAAQKAVLSGTENRATKKIEKEKRIQESKKETATSLKSDAKAMQSAVEKFNSRLEKTKALRKERDAREKDEEKSISMTSSVERIKKEVDETLVLSQPVSSSSSDEVGLEVVKSTNEDVKNDTVESVSVMDELSEKLVESLEMASTPVINMDERNLNFDALNSMNHGVVYTNILTKFWNPSVEHNISANADKVIKFIRCSKVTGLILGYIIYYARTREEMKDTLLKYSERDKRYLYVNTLLKRYDQKHFNNYYSVV